MYRPLQPPKLLKLRASDGPISADLPPESPVLAELPDADLGAVEFDSGLGGGEIFGAHNPKSIAIDGSRQVDFVQPLLP